MTEDQFTDTELIIISETLLPLRSLLRQSSRSEDAFGAPLELATSLVLAQNAHEYEDTADANAVSNIRRISTKARELANE